MTDRPNIEALLHEAKRLLDEQATSAGGYDERLNDIVELLANQAVAVPDGWREAVDDFLDAQDALDNRELMGPNAEDHSVLMRRRNNARDDLDNALSAAPPAPAPVGLGDYVTAKLRGVNDCRQGWVVSLRIRGESGKEYECEGAPVLVGNPPASPAPVGDTLRELDEDDAADSYEIDGMGD